MWGGVGGAGGGGGGEMIVGLVGRLGLSVCVCVCVRARVCVCVLGRGAARDSLPYAGAEVFHPPTPL